MTWDPETSCGYEAQKVKFLTVPYTRGVGLDIGCGPERVWPHAIGLDRVLSDKGAAIHTDIETLPMFSDDSMDWVFSSHALEDFPAKKTEAILAEWCRPIKRGGFLILYLPHEDLYPKVGEEGCNVAHQRNFKPDDIAPCMPDGWHLIEDETRAEGNEYSFFQVWRRRAHRHDPAAADWPCHRSKSGKPVALVIRYGGFGDMIQASSVFPALKAQGFEVHVNTTPAGWDIIKHDPNVDGCLIQDTQQVPNDQLYEFWEALPERYAKVINLSESIEETLLARPGSKAHAWPHDRRHFMLDRNYMEFQHAIAGVPGVEPAPRFYPTAAEKAWAKTTRRKMKAGRVILWCLAGSSVHKMYPHQDVVLATLMRDDPDVRVVLVGDEICQLLEVGWEKEKRVLCRSGKWSIRKTLAFAEVADCVVGPETGVLNSVSMLQVPKVCMLSHSSRENLTKYWHRVVTLVPEGLPCYPCHQMHYGSEHCNVEEDTHAAMCAFSIKPEEVYGAIKFCIEQDKGLAA